MLPGMKDMTIYCYCPLDHSVHVSSLDKSQPGVEVPQLLSANTTFLYTSCMACCWGERV